MSIVLQNYTIGCQVVASLATVRSDMAAQVPDEAGNEGPSGLTKTLANSFKFWNKLPLTPSQRVDQDSYKTHSNNPPPGLFQYEPLDPAKNELRVIEILPISSSSISNSWDVECRLAKVLLDDNPAYEALSYCWGTQNERRHISLNGHDFEVSLNLEQALICLRSSTPRKIWVDAICIDQTSNKERNHQVSMMRSIYERATQVCVWLGPKDDDSNLAFELLYKLRHEITVDTSVKKLLGAQRHQRHLVAITNLFVRDYFFRVWVLQEVACAKKIMVYCGNDSINWSDFVMVQDCVASNHEAILEKVALHNPNLIHLRRCFVYAGPRLFRVPVLDPGSELPELLDVLIQSITKKSTDPRDKVFAIVGLTKAGDDRRLQIDYSKSVCQLFTEVSEYIISTSGLLDAIYIAPTSDPEFPSWVAGWSFEGYLVSPMYPWYRAAGTTRAVTYCDTDKGLLLAQGFCIDKVMIHVTKSDRESRLDLKGTMKTLCDYHILLREEFEDSRSQWTSFLNTLYMSPGEDYAIDCWWSVPAAKAIKRYCEKFCPETVHEELLWNIPWNENSSRKWDNFKEKIFVETIENNLYNRMFFISERKILGLGPQQLQKGDLICVLLGCSCPVILRAKDQHYFIIGPAYFDGYMWGKAMEEMEEGKFSLQDFEIH